MAVAAANRAKDAKAEIKKRFMGKSLPFNPDT
jgi:hypothetical protein